MKRPALAPADPLRDDGVAATETVGDVQRALGEADGARVGRNAVVVVERNDHDAVLRDIYGGREDDRSYDADGVRAYPSRVLLGGKDAVPRNSWLRG